MNAARKPMTVADLRMEMVAKVAAVAGLFVVFFAFAYSFFQIKWVSDQLGVDHAVLSYAFPFIIDLPSVVASALTVALHDREFRVRAYAWSILIVFTSLSWMCNAIHAVEKGKIVDTVPGPAGITLTILIAGIPPVGVVLGMHLWAYALRHSSGADQRAEVKTDEKKTGTPGKTAETKTEKGTGTGTVAPPPIAPPPPALVPTGSVAASDEESLVRAEFTRLVEAGATVDSIKANKVGKTVGVTVSDATVRRWVGKCKDEHKAAQADTVCTPEAPQHVTPEPPIEVAEARERERVGAA